MKLLKVTAALDAAAIPYAVIGGLAVAHHVGLVDRGAIRTTADVDLLINRDSLAAMQETLAKIGFKYCLAAGVHMFLDTPSAREGVHVIMAGEKVRPDYHAAAPTLKDVDRDEAGFAVLPLRELVVMKLTSFRDKDRTHLRDMIDVGLLPGAIRETLPDALRERLQMLLDNPE